MQHQRAHRPGPPGSSGPTITKLALTTRARVPGLDEEGFQKAANAAKENCVVSRALGGVEEITLDASLES